MRTIQHWIAGSETTGASTRYGAVWNPATGEQQAQVALAEPADVDAAVAAASKAFEEWRDVSLDPPGPHHVRPARPHRAAPGRALRAGRRRARQGRLRRQGRGHPRPGGGGVRLRHPHPAQGRVLRAGLHRRGRLLVPAAARRLRRDHPVQLPGHGADVDAPGRDRRREHVRPQAERARPVRVELHRPAVRRGRAARGRLQRGARGQGRGRRDPGPPRTSRRSRSSARRRSPGTCTSGRPQAGKRVQALGGAKNHAVVLPDADMEFAANHITAAGYGSAGQRCMAISAVVAVGDAGDALVAKLKEKAREIKVGPGRDQASEMGPVVTPEARDRITGYVDRGAAGRGHARGRRPRPGRRRARGRLLRRPDPVRPGHHRHGHLHRRDLRPGPGRAAGRDASTRPSTSSTPTRTATAPRSSPPAARRRGSSSATSRSG